MSTVLPKAIKLSLQEREQVSELLAVNHVVDNPYILYEWCGRVRYLLQSIRQKQLDADAVP